MYMRYISIAYKISIIADVYIALNVCQTLHQMLYVYLFT